MFHIVPNEDEVVATIGAAIIQRNAMVDLVSPRRSPVLGHAVNIFLRQSGCSQRLTAGCPDILEPRATLLPVEFVAESL